MANDMADTQVAVIGAGPGGYAAAFRAADLGLRVTLIDPEANPGGVCLYRGCIPTKALLHACKTVREARRAGAWGIRLSEPTVDIDALRSWKSSVVDGLTGGLGQLVRQRKITYLRGMARFVDERTLTVEMNDGGQMRLLFENAIVATGAKPVAIGGLSFGSPHVLDSAKALDLQSIPSTLLVVGGGYIGMELSTVYAVLGAKVTIVEMMPGLMPGADRDLMRAFRKETDGLYENIFTSTTAKFEEREDGIQVWFEGEHEDAGPRIYEKVLLTVGRRPAADGMRLEAAGIERDERGYVRVDERRRTNRQGIYAIGDIAGPPLLAHKATHEGRIAAEVIAGQQALFDPRVIPSVEYTDPEIAWCGLTETEAEAQGREVEVGRFPWAASGRAATLGQPGGLTKIVAEPQTGRVLGVGIVGTQAGELISEGALAIEMGATAADLALTIHPHPTLSETLMEAAETLTGGATHIAGRRRRS